MKIGAVISGLACPTGIWSDKPPALATQESAFKVRFLPGCFTNAILARNGLLLVQHREALAQAKDGSLELWEEDDGLHFRARLSNGFFDRWVTVGIQSGIIKHVCCGVEFEGDPFQDALDIKVVERVAPSLLILKDPHFSSTNVCIEELA